MQFNHELYQSDEKKSDGAGVWAQVARATIWSTNHYTTPSLFEGILLNMPLIPLRDTTMLTLLILKNQSLPKLISLYESCFGAIYIYLNLII